VSQHLSEGARLTVATRKVKHDLKVVSHPSCLENDVVLVVRERSGELHRVVLVRADASAVMLRGVVSVSTGVYGVAGCCGRGRELTTIGGNLRTKVGTLNEEELPAPPLPRSGCSFCTSKSSCH
jgi:hypothetical protein